jgi:chromosome segregation ATPase
MKAAIRKVLAGIGLATAAQVRHADAQAQHSARKAEQRMARLRTSAEGWKQRYEDASKAAAEWKHTAVDARTSAERTAGKLEHARAHVDEWKSRAEALATQVRDLKERLDETRRVTTVARQHLMATEVKLDLIEAAVQVLDARTREGALPRP